MEVTNLHRQILHREAKTGDPKCQSAKESCQALNSLVSYRLHHVAITSSNALDLVSQYDVILDCTDNVATRYLVNDACILVGKVSPSVFSSTFLSALCAAMRFV